MLKQCIRSGVWGGLLILTILLSACGGQRDSLLHTGTAPKVSSFFGQVCSGAYVGYGTNWGVMYNYAWRIIESDTSDRTGRLFYADLPESDVRTIGTPTSVPVEKLNERVLKYGYPMSVHADGAYLLFSNPHRPVSFRIWRDPDTKRVFSSRLIGGVDYGVLSSTTCKWLPGFRPIDETTSKKKSE